MDNSTASRVRLVARVDDIIIKIYTLESTLVILLCILYMCAYIILLARTYTVLK